MEAVAGKSAGLSAGGGSVAVAPHVSGCDHPKAVPGYLRPAAGSCHHVCKYGGQHTFGEKKDHARKQQPAKPGRQPPATSDGPQRKAKPLLKARSVSRRRVVDSSKPEKANAPMTVVVDDGKEGGGEEAVEWKDVVAYEDSSAKSEEIDGYRKKKDAMKGKKSRDNGSKIAGEEESGVTKSKKKSESMNKKLVKSVRSKQSGMAPTKPEPQSASKAASPSLKNASSAGGKSVKPPPPPRVKRAAASPAEKKAADQRTALEDDEATATDAKEEEPIVAVEAHRPLDQEHAAAAEERSRPIPAHRRVRSMSMISLSSRSVRFSFVRQAIRSSGATAFKLRSRSSKAPSDQEEAPARLRFRSKARAAAGEEPAGSSSGGGGVQLRTTSHRRWGSFGGFEVPAVALRHEKTLEKKRSRRLHNTLIEETASRLAKARKSRVKALVGAFETLISKIGK